MVYPSAEVSDTTLRAPALACAQGLSLASADGDAALTACQELEHHRTTRAHTHTHMHARTPYPGHFLCICLSGTLYTPFPRRISLHTHPAAGHGTHHVHGQTQQRRATDLHTLLLLPVCTLLLIHTLSCSPSRGIGS